MTLDRDTPWLWSPRDVLGLFNDRQRKYVETVAGLFAVKTAAGRVVDYDPRPYQAWFHAHSPLVMGPKAPDRLVVKGRGLGLTLMTAMDLLLLAHQLDRVHIPVAGRQSSTGDEFIQKTHDLIQDARIEGFFDPDPNVTSMVRLGNGSTIEAIPGGNPSSLRSRRAPAAAFDEYAFHPRPKEIWRAGRGVLSEGGQLTVISTHDGAGTHFYELEEQARTGESGFAYFYYPTHDPVAYQADQPVPGQVESGRLRLIAPWIDLGVLETLRREDPPGYAQEHLCRVMDETLNLLSRDLVQRLHDDALESWAAPVHVEDSPRLADLHGLTVPRRPAGNTNPCFLGVDFASKEDLCAWSLVEAAPDGLVQRWVAALRGVKTPAQNAFLRLVERLVRPRAVAIDMTGGGTGLYEYAEEELQCTVLGIHYGSSVELQRQKVPVKKAMALTLSATAQEGGLRLLGGDPLSALQRRHLISVRRADLDAPKKPGEGHADLFWALAQAVWASRVDADALIGGVIRPSSHGGYRAPSADGVVDDDAGGVLRPTWRRPRR